MPNLTSKELTALDEQLSYEKILIEKYNAMAADCTDSTMKTSLTNIAELHKTHYNSLLNFLG